MCIFCLFRATDDISMQGTLLAWSNTRQLEWRIHYVINIILNKITSIEISGRIGTPRHLQKLKDICSEPLFLAACFCLLSDPIVVIIFSWLGLLSLSLCSLYSRFSAADTTWLRCVSYCRIANVPLTVLLVHRFSFRVWNYGRCCLPQRTDASEMSHIEDITSASEPCISTKGLCVFLPNAEGVAARYSNQTRSP